MLAKYVLSAVFLLSLLFFAPRATAEAAVEGAVEVAPVWAGHPVGFCLLTHPPRQYVAFYDAERRMTAASRDLGEAEWTLKILDETIGWDSHNYIAMVVDDDGYLHLSGNMHVHPLTYFRTEKPLDITTFTRVPAMVGREEDRVTYPVFFRGPDNALLFTYRDGKSGAGNQIYNVYDQATQTWRRLLDTPLLDGEGKRNAYLQGPMKGPDGYWHLCWVWRETADCATNHDPSYARSKDLVHWESSGGKALHLPITLETGEIVDPVPPGGGVINGNVKLGFDVQQRVIVSYHKYDEAGILQLYNARLEDGAWRIHQSSAWAYRWEFSGGGSIHFEVRIEPVRVEAGTLAQGWSHDQYGRQKWQLDPETLNPVTQLELPPSSTPRALTTVTSEFPGMQVQMRGDSGTSGEAGIRYLARWETLGRNRDRPRDKPWPEPSMLRIYRIKQ